MPDDYELKIDALLSEPLNDAKSRAGAAFSLSLRGDPHCPILIYGAGFVGRKVAASMVENKYNLVGFVDQNASSMDSFIEDIPVFSPFNAARQYGDRAVCVVAAVNHNPGSAYGGIAGNLQEMGFGTIVPFGVYAWSHPAGLLPHYCIDRPEVILQRRDDVRRALTLLQDAGSKKVFAEQLSLRLLMDLQNAGAHSEDPAYFPEAALEKVPEEMVFVDCGAFDGDTLQVFLSTSASPKLGFYHAIEPDLHNYRRLCSYLDTLPSSIREKVTPIQKAVSDYTGKTVFTSGTDTAASHIDQAGEYDVECITIDLLIGKGREGKGRCDFIKMDIEGFEREAIMGARETIAREKPLLAICVYHKPEDFFDLMLLIKEIRPDYEFMIARYACDIWDVVLYAI